MNSILIVFPILTLLMFDLGLSLEFKDFLMVLAGLFFIGNRESVISNFGVLGLSVTSLLLAADHRNRSRNAECSAGHSSCHQSVRIQ